MTSFFRVVDHSLMRVYQFSGGFAAVAIVVIAAMVATSIVSRLLGVYIGGLTEIAGYAMAAAGSFGLAYTFGSAGHIRVDLVLSVIPARATRVAESISLLLTTGVIIYLAWYLVRMVLISLEYGDLSDGSDELPIWIPQLPCAIGFVIFAVSLVHHTLRYWFLGSRPWQREASNIEATETADGGA